MTELVNEYDLNKDGIVEETELEKIKEIKEIEYLNKKQKSQRDMAFISLFSMIIFTIAIMIPGFISDSRIEQLSDFSDIFYISMAGIVGAYMGMSAWMSRKGS